MKAKFKVEMVASQPDPCVLPDPKLECGPHHGSCESLYLVELVAADHPEHCKTPPIGSVKLRNLTKDVADKFRTGDVYWMELCPINPPASWKYSNIWTDPDLTNTEP